MRTRVFALPLRLSALVLQGSVLAILALAPFQRAAASEQSTVQIYFVDSATGCAIEPEHILVKSHGMGAEEKSLGDSRVSQRGRASVNLSPGRHTITVTSPNHQSMSEDLVIGENTPRRFHFLLDPIEKPPELQLKNIEALHRDGATLFQGFIVDDETGEPLQDVRVESSPDGAKTESDTRGYFRIYVPVRTEAENEKTSLAFEKPGYRGVERQHLELWSRGDWTYCMRLERGGGLQKVDERNSRRREGGVGEPVVAGTSIPNLTSEFQNRIEPASVLKSPSASDVLEPASTLPSNATVRVPRNIRVEDGGIIYYVSMNYYVKHTLTHEWIASWSTNSLNAGSVAVRCYAIARLNGRSPTGTSDICGDSNCQNFKTVETTSRGDNAVDYTEDYVLINGSGNIPSTEYSAENNSIDRGDCGDGFTAPTSGCLYDPVCIGKERSGHGRGMCQRGSERWSTGEKGFPKRDWVWILEHYYPTLRLVKGAPLVIGDDVKSRSSDCEVRVCPGGGIDDGTACGLITTKSPGQTGVIIGGPLRVTSDGKGFTWYQIQWNDAGPTTGWSCENYLERVFSAPTAPTSLTATPVSTNRINLAWTDTSNVESSFDIERAPSLSGPWIEIGTVGANVTNYSDFNLFSANTWFYRVRARNAGGATSYTTSASATTLGAVAPTLAPMPDRTISRGVLFTFTAVATAAERAQPITDFEPFMSETANGVVLFETPTNSSTTRSFINSDVNVGLENLAAVVDTYPISGYTTGKVLLVSCEFTNANNPWLRLVTLGTTLPNPVIDFTKKLRFNIRADREIRVAAGCRETSTAAGTAIGSDGGTSGAIEWVGATGLAGTAPVPNHSVSSNSWTTLTFDFPNEPIRSFSGGNGILSTASGLGVLDHLAIVPMAGVGVYDIYLDNLTVIGPPKFVYSLGSNAPAGVSIHPTTGVFAWTPSQSQSPSTNIISVIVTDDNLPPLSATNTFTVVVKESVPNSPPLLAPVSNRTVNAGGTVIFTNSAYDSNPSDTLTFSLNPGAPPLASINSTNGVFKWITAEADANTTNSITVRVADNGTPSFSSTANFSITVLPKNNPPLLAPVSNRSVHAGETVIFTNLAFDPGDILTFSLDPGAPTAANIHPANGVFTWITTEAEAYSTNSITVRVTDNGQPPLSGTVVFSVAVYPELMIESISESGGTVTMTWGAVPNGAYRIEYKTNLYQPDWLLSGNVTSSGDTASFSEATEAHAQRYYRVVATP